MNMPKIPPDKIPELSRTAQQRRELSRSRTRIQCIPHDHYAQCEETRKSSPEPPGVFHGFKRYDKVNLLCDVDFPYHPLKKGEEVQIIDFDKPENVALVTSHRYSEALDVPIDALQKKES